MPKWVEIANTETKYFNVLNKDRVDEVDHGGKRRHLHFYWAVCKRCGRKVSVRKEYLKGDRNQSCGCLILRAGSEHKDWKGYGELSACQAGDYERSAHRRGLEFDVSPAYLWEVFLAQERRCALTGLPLHFRKTSSKRTGNASLDRIRNEEGYVPGNVRWVTVDANLIKRTLTDDQLLYYCRKVVQTIGAGVVECEELPAFKTTHLGRQQPKTKGMTKRQANVKKKMPPRWWHKPLESTES